MSANIEGANSPFYKQFVDPFNAAYVIQRDSAGNPVAVANRASISDLAGGQLLAVKDYEIGRTLRGSPTGDLRGMNDLMLLWDMVEGAAVDTNKWIQTLTTHTVTQASGVITFNANNTTTINTGAMHLSHQFFPKIMRSPLVWRGVRKFSALFNGPIIEFGFGSPASAIAASLGNGACFRKDSGGQLVPVVSIGGTEIVGASPLSDAILRAGVSGYGIVAVADFATFEIIVEDDRATFKVTNHAGNLVYEAVIEYGSTSGSFTGTHLQALDRIWNFTAPSTAMQYFTSGTAVYQLDNIVGLSFRELASGMCNNSLTSPTAYTQAAKIVNNTAPTAITLSNTAISAGNNDTLGGCITANAMVGSLATPADSILSGWLNPSPFTFFCTGVRIPVPINGVAAVATTDTLLTYQMGFNSSAISLATAGAYPPMKITLADIHSAIIGLAASKLFTGNTINAVFDPPIAVMPGRYVHCILRCLLGTATATETYRWDGVEIQGFYR